MNDCRFGVSPVNYPDPDHLSKDKFLGPVCVCAELNRHLLNHTAEIVSP